MYIGDGAKMIRDAFELAREKGKDRGGAIIFIDEIDAIGGKRGGDEKSGGREVQRTMLELLNQVSCGLWRDIVGWVRRLNKQKTHCIMRFSFLCSWMVLIQTIK